MYDMEGHPSRLMDGKYLETSIDSDNLRYVSNQGYATDLYRIYSIASILTLWFQACYC